MINLPLHRGALLLTHPIVIEVLAGQTFLLCWPSAAASAEQMTAFSGFGAETTALRTLWRAVGLAELLTIVGTITPAATLTVWMALGAITFGGCEIVSVLDIGVGSLNGGLERNISVIIRAKKVPSTPT